ncbi:MAG: T9SS type A sorting domain-containing protein, partial [bacterium]|nr:T9SS type A sorting domain-containing protein [Candidatus Limimorpha equi]
KLEAEIEGETVSMGWEGELPQYGIETIEIPVEVPFGSHSITVKVIEANGTPFSAESSAAVSCQEWTDIEIDGEETEIELQLMQDKFGNQITWEATASDGTVLASGGPYAMLMGGTGTQLHIERFAVPANECVKFSIYDNVGNGMCCSYGHGYFILYDANDNVIFGDEDDGEFGSEASTLISVKGQTPQATVGETEVEMVTEIDANFLSSLDYVGYPDEVGFEYRKVTSSTVNTVVGIINEFKQIMASVEGLDEASIYMVKAYAVIEGQTVYGPEATFNTGNTGVNEFENSVKIYPNPASDVLNVAGENIANVEVYNAMGQLVLSQEVADGQAQISTGSMNSGIYFIRIYSQNGEMQTRMFSVAK